MNDPLRTLDPRNVAVLGDDNVAMLDIAGLADVFCRGGLYGRNNETVLVSPDRRDVRTSNGLTVRRDCVRSDLGKQDESRSPVALS